MRHIGPVGVVKRPQAERRKLSSSAVSATSQKARGASEECCGYMSTATQRCQKPRTTTRSCCYYCRRSGLAASKVGLQCVDSTRIWFIMCPTFSSDSLYRSASAGSLAQEFELQRSTFVCQQLHLGGPRQRRKCSSQVNVRSFRQTYWSSHPSCRRAQQRRWRRACGAAATGSGRRAFHSGDGAR